MTTALLIATGIVVGVFIVVVFLQAEARSRPRERRNIPARARRDFEMDRIRDHLFDRLSCDDVAWLVEQGWRAPPEVVRTWNELSRYQRISNMTPAEYDALCKARIAGVHVTAHPDDVRFSPGR